MSQMQTGGPRRKSSGAPMDVYTALALAGTFALIVAFVILWIAGTELATDGNVSEMPWMILSGS